MHCSLSIDAQRDSRHSHVKFACKLHSHCKNNSTLVEKKCQIFLQGRIVYFLFLKYFLLAYGRFEMCGRVIS